MEFGKDFFKEEILWEHTVTEKNKRIWAVELNLLEELNRICRKHSITYFAIYGTLLGAVRHKGFIPWDDDIDVVMMRDQYEAFRKIVRQELKPPYTYQDSYDGYYIRSLAKIRDPRTSFFEHEERCPADFNQGIYIDIFIFDDALDDPSEITPAYRMKRELWMVMCSPDKVLQMIGEGHPFFLDADMLTALCHDDPLKTYALLEQFCAQHFGETRTVNTVAANAVDMGYKHERRWFESAVYLPFHDFQIPAPCGYHEFLTHKYGDYMQPVKGRSCHENSFIDPDRPYTDYL